MTVRPTTQHDIQRDDENTTRPNFAVIQTLLVTGTLGMTYSGYDPGTGNVVLVSSGTFVTAETNANDIYACVSPGGISAWTGSISGTPAGAIVSYNHISGQEAALKPNSTTQLAKLRIYNITRNNNALISDDNTSTHKLTLTANAPANWANGDTITIGSQTTSGGGFSWIDLEITSGPMNKNFIFMKSQITSSTVGDSLRIHPFTASFSSSKLDNLFVQSTTASISGFGLIIITGNVFSIAWTGTPSSIALRESGYVT